MTGAAEQYQYILRDESMHCNFGIDLINKSRPEKPPFVDVSIQGQHPRSCSNAPSNWNTGMPKTPCPRRAWHECFHVQGYLRFIANRRATQIGLEPLFPECRNPFPWMSEMIDLKKERNFFETRVIEYQSGGTLSWDKAIPQ